MKFHITEIDAPRIKCNRCKNENNFATMRISLEPNTTNSCDECLGVVIRDMILRRVVRGMNVER